MGEVAASSFRRPDVTIAAAKAELDSLGRALAKQYPDDNEGETATLTPMKEFGVVPLKPTLIALSGAVRRAHPPSYPRRHRTR